MHPKSHGDREDIGRASNQRSPLNRGGFFVYPCNAPEPTVEAAGDEVYADMCVGLQAVT